MVSGWGVRTDEKDKRGLVTVVVVVVRKREAPWGCWGGVARVANRDTSQAFKTFLSITEFISRVSTPSEANLKDFSRLPVVLINLDRSTDRIPSSCPAPEKGPRRAAMSMSTSKLPRGDLEMLGENHPYSLSLSLYFSLESTRTSLYFATFRGWGW